MKFDPAKPFGGFKLASDIATSITNKRKTGRFRKIGSVPNKGYAWNPLTGFPRNKPCFCSSGLKAKRCCLPKLARVVKADFAKALSTNWSRLVAGELVLKQSPFGVTTLEAA